MSTSTTSDTALADPPSRATASFTLQWGLVPVKLRLFTAFEDTTPVKRSLYTRTGNKVGQPKVDTVTGERVDSDQIQTMVELDGKLLELTDEEMAEVTSDYEVDRQAVSITFIPLDTLGDRYKVEKSYQARSGMTATPKKSVADPQADKAFALLLQSMAKKKVACLFRASLKGPARWAALTPDGTVHFLYYFDEVRQQKEWPDVTISKVEAQQGLDLIDLVGVSTPDLIDERGAALIKFLKAKLKSGKGIERKDETGAPVGGVLDLTAALKASLAAATKAKKSTKRAA